MHSLHNMQPGPEQRPDYDLVSLAAENLPQRAYVIESVPSEHSREVSGPVAGTLLSEKTIAERLLAGCELRSDQRVTNPIVIRTASFFEEVPYLERIVLRVEPPRMPGLEQIGANGLRLAATTDPEQQARYYMGTALDFQKHGLSDALLLDPTGQEPTVFSAPNSKGHASVRLSAPDRIAVSNEFPTHNASSYKQEFVEVVTRNPNYHGRNLLERALGWLAAHHS